MIEFLIISALSIVGLFQAEKSMSPIDQSRIHPQIEPYIRSFEETFDVKITGISADFYVEPDPNNKINASCFESAFYIAIRIDYDWWLWAPEESREHIVWHELGHCYFDFAHDETMIYDYPVRPKSTMYPHMSPNSTYETFRRDYIKELKQKIDAIKTYRPEGIL